MKNGVNQEAKKPHMSVLLQNCEIYSGASEEIQAGKISREDQGFSEVKTNVTIGVLQLFSSIPELKNIFYSSRRCGIQTLCWMYDD